MVKQLLIILAASLALAGCNVEQSADTQQAAKTAELAKAADDAVGMPNIKNFREKRLVKMLYELRDTELATHTYYLDMQGGKHFLCDSVGYGINASVQYSNPERYARPNSNSNYTTLPQPEPNGLFMPEGLAATYTMCVFDGKVTPIYVEPEILVSPVRLD